MSGARSVAEVVTGGIGVCHQCARPLQNYSGSNSSEPEAGMCPKHGVSYDRRYAGSEDYIVFIESTCPVDGCGGPAYSDRDGNTFCHECGYDEYTES